MLHAVLQCLVGLFADAFADMKTGRRIVKKITSEKPKLAKKIFGFMNKVVKSVKKIFNPETPEDVKELREKYPSVSLTDIQFNDFITRIDNTIEGFKNLPKEKTPGTYKLLTTGLHLIHSPHACDPKTQTAFDQTAIEFMTEDGFKPGEIFSAIKNLSPFSENENYLSQIFTSQENDTEKSEFIPATAHMR